MPPQDLADAYIRGSISRRVFVRRMVAAGFSVGTAVAYSELLTPDWALAEQRGIAPYTNFICYIPPSYTEYWCYGVPSYTQQPPTYIPPKGSGEPPPVTQTPPPAAAPPPPPSPPPPPPVIPTTLASVRVSRLSLATMLLTGRLVVVVHTGVPCRLTLTATLHRAKRRKHRHHSAEASRSVTLSSSHATVHKAGSHRLKLKLRRSGRAALRSLRRKHSSLGTERIKVTVRATGNGAPPRHKSVDVHLHH